MTDPATVPDDSFFLSYSRKDEAFALRLAEALRDQGIRIWIDQLDIRPSEHWDRAIERAVRDSRGIVVLLSPRSVASDNVADEISFAIDNGRTVLPVMIEACGLPLRIARMQVIDATCNFPKVVQQCVAELRRTQARGGTRPPTQSDPDRSLDGEAVLEVKHQLGVFVGPIAAMLVDKAALRAASVQELYRLVSAHIEGDADRERFLAAAPRSTERRQAFDIDAQPGTAAIPGGEIDALSTMLTRYIGPIATVLARKETVKSKSIEDLTDRLAGAIPNETERSQFLREARSRRT